MGMPISPFEATSSSMIRSQSTTTSLRIAGDPEFSLSVLMRRHLYRDTAFVVPMQSVTTESRPGLRAASGQHPGRPDRRERIQLPWTASSRPRCCLSSLRACTFPTRRPARLQTVFILVYALPVRRRACSVNRCKRLHVAAAGVAVWTPGHLCSGLVASFAWLALARAVVGIGDASYTVVTPSLLAELTTRPNRRGRALSGSSTRPCRWGIGARLCAGRPDAGGASAGRPAFCVAGGQAWR